MNKFSLIAIVGVSFLLSACGMSQPMGDRPPMDDRSTRGEVRTEKTQETVPNSQKVSKQECMNGCYVMWKSNEGNVGKPESEMQNSCEDLCNASQGMQNNDLSSCEKTSDPMVRSACYGEVAKQTREVSICDKITESLLKDACIMGVAEASLDASLCDKISEPIMKPACQDSIKSELK